MPDRRKFRLRKLKLKELSLVDRGANPRADVVFTKRAVAPLLFHEVATMLRSATSTPS